MAARPARRIYHLTAAGRACLDAHTRSLHHVHDVLVIDPRAGNATSNCAADNVADAGAAVAVLLVAVTLSVYKPRGLTPCVPQLSGGPRHRLVL